ncbi:MAG: hypothetical protein AB1609_11605 [Bacillota bacterium]
MSQDARTAAGISLILAGAGLLAMDRHPELGYALLAMAYAGLHTALRLSGGQAPMLPA